MYIGTQLGLMNSPDLGKKQTVAAGHSRPKFGHPNLELNKAYVHEKDIAQEFESTVSYCPV
jgi:hypothetical protein